VLNQERNKKMRTLCARTALTWRKHFVTHRPSATDWSVAFWAWY